MEKFTNIPGVDNVHDLHIWNISSTSISLTCHMRVSYFDMVKLSLLTNLYGFDRLLILNVL